MGAVAEGGGPTTDSFMLCRMSNNKLLNCARVSKIGITRVDIRILTGSILAASRFLVKCIFKSRGFSARGLVWVWEDRSTESVALCGTHPVS